MAVSTLDTYMQLLLSEYEERVEKTGSDCVEICLTTSGGGQGRIVRIPPQSGGIPAIESTYRG